jgi:hypothetical protein
MVTSEICHTYGCYSSWAVISKAFGKELLRIISNDPKGLCLWPIAMKIAEGNKQWAKDLIQQFEIYQIILLVEDGGRGHIDENTYLISRELLDEYRLY